MYYISEYINQNTSLVVNSKTNTETLEQQKSSGQQLNIGQPDQR